MANVTSFDLSKTTVVVACVGAVAAATGGIQMETQTLVCAHDVEYVPGECLVSHGAEFVTYKRAAQWTDFQALVKEWRSARGARSTVAEMAMLPSYQRIIGMGPDIVPMILAELKSEGDQPDHWFWALAAITRDNPVPQKSRGKTREMAKAWLEWGEKAGHVHLG